MSLLEVENLSVEFATPGGPVRVVVDVDFALERGESLGLVGESGCGKSLTGLAVLGLLPEGARARGRVLLDGVDLLALDEAARCKIRGRRVAMVFQEPMTALNPVRTIGEQVAEGLRLHYGSSRAEAAERAGALLERVGLSAPRLSPKLYPHELSGGQRQRVVIALALACGPDLLIADEPTTALDVTTQARILDLVAGLVAEEDMGLLLITHDLGIIAEATDSMLVMYAGAIVERGPTAEVFRRMAHPYTRGLFAAIPRLGHEGRPVAARLPTIPGQVPAPADRPAGCAFAERCCRVADDCRRQPPREAEVGEDHRAACLYPGRDRPGRDRPGRDGATTGRPRAEGEEVP